MKFDKTRIALAFVVVFVVFSLLTFLFWDFVRNTIVVPIYYFIWITGLILKSIPQEVFVGVLVVVSAIVGINTLTRIRREPAAGEQKRPTAQVDTRYQHWSRLCDNLYGSRFSRKLFASEARKLILNILAYEYGIDSEEAEARVNSGEFDVSQEIRNLIQHQEIEDVVEPLTNLDAATLRLKRLLGRAEAPHNPQIDRLVAEITGFIETHVEVPYGRSQPES